MNTDCSRSGASLILAVLLLAAITVLIGFGRLAMYRNQVKLRLDREREIQQELATRSAMRWLETHRTDDALPSEDVAFRFPTLRGDIGVTLCPADPVFPRRNEAGDFDIGKPDRNSLSSGGYVHADSSIEIGTSKNNLVVKLADKEINADVGKDPVGLAIDIDDSRAAALWTDSDYGLRYLVHVTDFCQQNPGVHDSDILRFALTPKGKPLHPSGGSPQSQYAIWMEQVRPKEWEVEAGTATSAKLFLMAREPGMVNDGSVLLSTAETRSADNAKGFQLASTKASLLQQELASDTPDSIRATRTYPVVDLEKQMGTGFVEGFAKACEAAGGVRLTVEVEVQRPRPQAEDGTIVEDTFKTYVSRIAVTPAYEYTTELAWSERNGNRTEETSTFIRCDPGVHGESDEGTISTVTYDTHGTYANRKDHLGDLER